jgi:hypothetical protein
MDEAVLDKADCAGADSSARRPQQGHQHRDRRPLARPGPGPAARTSHQLRRCNSRPAPGPARTGSGRPHHARGAGRDERRRGHNKPAGQRGEPAGDSETASALANGEYSVHVTEAELSLMTTALETTERVSRFGMEVLDKADQAMDGRRPDTVRLRREIEALAIREASVRSLRKL